MEESKINVNTEVDLVGVFVQNNQKFYKNKFDKMKESGKSISWNWAAFFMGIYWMVYRKMYFKAGAFLLLSMVALQTPYIGSILNFCILVGIAVYANALYLDHVEGNIKKASMIFPHDKEAVLRKKGGTNLPLTIALVVVQIVVVSIVFGTIL